jgi:hypothetical protein
VTWPLWMLTLWPAVSLAVGLLFGRAISSTGRAAPSDLARAARELPRELPQPPERVALLKSSARDPQDHGAAVEASRRDFGACPSAPSRADHPDWLYVP